MVLRILNVETSMLSVKGQNMASVNMVKDVTKFIFQISDKNDPCEEKYCKKRPPVMCSYFKTYGKYKFGVFCEYNHSERIDNNFERDVEILKKEICDFKQV